MLTIESYTPPSHKDDYFEVKVVSPSTQAQIVHNSVEMWIHKYMQARKEREKERKQLKQRNNKKAIK